jgi:hypothetical protein
VCCSFLLRSISWFLTALLKNYVIDEFARKKVMGEERGDVSWPVAMRKRDQGKERKGNKACELLCHVKYVMPMKTKKPGEASKIKEEKIK